MNGCVQLKRHHYSVRGCEAGMKADVYDALAHAVTAAGFFTNGVEDHGTWHRTCVCSKRRPDGTLTGNSFWVSRLPSGWYLGTWGSHLYRLPDETRLVDLCIDWLSRVPNGTRPDFDERLKREFGLLPVSEEAFDQEAGIADPGDAPDPHKLS